MPSAWLTNFLAELEDSSSPNRQPTTQEIAADIIRKSNKYGYKLDKVKSQGYGNAAAVAAQSNKSGGGKGPSTIQRIMDVLSRPLYGTAEALKQDVKHGGLIDSPHFFGIGDQSGEAGAITKGAALGFAGKRKTTSANVYEAAGMGKGHGVGGFLRNFATDVLIDPLNAVPFGAVAKGIRGARAGKAATETAVEAETATARVERALNHPTEVLNRTNRSTSVPNLRRVEGKTTAKLTKLDPVAERIKSTAGLSRTLPAGQTRRSMSLGGGELRQVPLKVAEVLAKVIPAPKLKAVEKAIEKTAPVAAPKQFRLDVNKIAAIEIARAVAPKGSRTSQEYKAAKELIDSEGSIPLYHLSGKEGGKFNAKKIHEYFKTGKIDAPKESEIPDYHTASPEAIHKYESHLFSEKQAPNNFYVKNIDADGNETLVSLAQVRKNIQLVKKSKKLKDELPDEVVADVAKTEEFAPSVPDFEIASATDIIDAAGEGSKAAHTALEKAAENTAPKALKTTGTLTEEGGRAVAKVADRYSVLVRQATFKNNQFNPAKQANAFRDLEKELVDEGLMSGFTKVSKDKLVTASVGKIADTRRSIAMKHLVALEDAMTAAGHPPMTFGSKAFPLRMSDLIQASGGIHTVLAAKGTHLTDLFGTAPKLEKFLDANPAALQVAESAQAAHVVATADLVEKGKSAAISAASKAELDPAKTAAEVAESLREAPSVAREVVKASAGIPNPEAARMAAENTRRLIQEAKPEVNKVTERYSKHFDATVMTGKITKDTVKGSVAQQKAALDIAGVEIKDIASEVSKASDSQAAQGLIAGLMKAFKPDFLQEELRPYYIENRSLFQTNTSKWAHALSATYKKYPKDVRANAWKSLQRGRNGGSDIEVAAAKEFQDTMESMFGASGFKDAVTSDVRREAITMNDINGALKGKFKFSNEVVDELGDVKHIDDWTDSWKYHDLDGQDPVEFIKQLRDGVDRTMLDKTMFDQIATIFGKPGKTSFGHKRLQGVEFSSEMKPQVARFLEVLDDVAKPNGKFALQYDTALRAWKSGVTIYSPSHHIRNLVGDTFIAWLAGVNNPRVYAKAASVLKSNRHLYEDMQGVDNLLGKGVISKSLSRQAKVKIVRAGGKNLDAEQVYTIMYNRGLLPHSRVIEDIPTGGVDELKLPQPLGGRGKKVARGVSESREHFSRIAHFIDALGKSGAKDVNQAIDEATRIVRKWHPDGLDLTNFEHRWVRRAFPFYSWTRKAIPLMIEGAVKRPAKIIAPNKALYNLQISMGLDPESMSEPFPVDKEFPDWVRDMAYGPVLGGGRTIVGSNLNPFTSVGEQLANDPRKGLAGLLTPAVRVPGELLSQSDWQTGQPMSTMDKTEYIDKQIPLVSVANRIGQGNFGAGSVEALTTGNKSAMFNHKKKDKTSSPHANRDAFLNYLIAAGLIDTQSPANLKSAEYDRRDRVAAARKKAAG